MEIASKLLKYKRESSFIVGTATDTSIFKELLKLKNLKFGIFILGPISLHLIKYQLVVSPKWPIEYKFICWPIFMKLYRLNHNEPTYYVPSMKEIGHKGAL